MLGIDVHKIPVVEYSDRRHEQPSKNWLLFLGEYAETLISTDFFAVPAASFGMLFGFLVLANHRHRVMGFNFIARPISEWAAHQVAEIFPWDDAPRLPV